MRAKRLRPCSWRRTGALIAASLELGTQDSSIGIPLWNALAGKGRHRITNTSRELETGYAFSIRTAAALGRTAVP